MDPWLTCHGCILSKIPKYRKPILFRIGNIYREQMDLNNVALPFLSQLAASEKETVQLAVLSDFQALYIGKIESSQSIRIMPRIGSSNPCYSTGVGKAILALLDEEEIRRFFDTVKLERFTRKRNLP